MDVNIYTLCRYRFPKQKNDKWRFILLSTNQCPFQVMVQNALFATLMVNSVMFDSAWQLWCTLVNLDLMSCQNKNVDWCYERASDLTIEKCIYVYTIPLCQYMERAKRCPTFVLHSISSPSSHLEKTIISQGNLLDLRPDSLCQVAPAEITGIA